MSFLESNKSAKAFLENSHEKELNLLEKANDYYEMNLSHFNEMSILSYTIDMVLNNNVVSKKAIKAYTDYVLKAIKYYRIKYDDSKMTVEDIIEGEKVLGETPTTLKGRGF